MRPRSCVFQAGSRQRHYEPGLIPLKVTRGSPVRAASPFPLAYTVFQFIYSLVRGLNQINMVLLDQNTFGINKRSGIDRRNHTGISIRSLVGAGKRLSIRRREDNNRIFVVDLYSQKLFVTILAVVFLSITDGFLTLYLMGRGAYEVNPVMAYVLDVSPSAFVIAKYTLTCIASLIVLMLRNVVIRRTKYTTHVLLYCFAGTFAAVIAWEIYLIWLV